MITEIILYLFYSIFWLICQVFLNTPNVSLPSYLLVSSNISSYLSNISFLLEKDTLIHILTLVISVESAIILFKGINWILKKIPFIK